LVDCSISTNDWLAQISPCSLMGKVGHCISNEWSSVLM
jgi:hypothetical protein